MTLPNQDFIRLAGRKSPGRARITGASDPRKWDKRQGYGFTGGQSIYTGDELSEFSVMIDLTKPADFDEWRAFAVLLQKPSALRNIDAADVSPAERARRLDAAKDSISRGPDARYALGIEHPLLRLAPLNITEVVVTDVSQFEVDDDGVYTCEIKFLVFGARKPVLVKPTAAIPAVAQRVPTAKDAGEQMALNLLAERDRLAALIAR